MLFLSFVYRMKLSSSGFAVRFYGSSHPIKVEEASFPHVENGQVLVKIKAAGVCASDIHFYHRTKTPAKVPLILGHEGAGVVEKVGSNVENTHEGDHVCIHYVISCGECNHCLEGRDNLCVNVKWAGFDVDGTFSEYILLPARNVLPLPEWITLEHGALIGCAVVTPFHAMSVGEVKPGDSVTILGIGGVGIHAIQMARIFGADRIIAVDIAEYKLKLAEEFGADVTVNSKEEDAVEAVNRATKGKGSDIVFEFVGSAQTILQSLRMTGRGGRAVLVGIYRGSLEFDITRLLYEEKQLRTSMDHTKWDLKKAIDLVANGRIDLSKSVTHKLPLRNALKGLEILEKKVGNPVRVVLIP